MPFKWGIPYMVFFVAITLIGFWTTYFSNIAGVPIEFHVHAVTALVWLALLLLQTWSIQNGKNQLHKTTGKASFLLFPLLILGFVMIVNRAAARFGHKLSEPEPIELSIGAITLVSIAAYLVLYALALKNRRNVKLHGGYMLATPLILFESPGSRATGKWLNWPSFDDRTPFQTFADSIAALDAIALVAAIAIYLTDRKHGAPWLLASGFLVVQSIVAYYPDAIPGFRSMFASYATLPPVVTLLGAVFAGAAAGWLGWQSGKSKGRSNGRKTAKA